MHAVKVAISASSGKPSYPVTFRLSRARTYETQSSAFTVPRSCWINIQCKCCYLYVFSEDQRLGPFFGDALIERRKLVILFNPKLPS
jgi:hypothetical protein